MFEKHPKGMVVLFFTEMWERFGFYIMMAILVLYMDKSLGWDDSQKGNYYSWFLGLCYFVPIIGGWIGDRLLGPIKTIRFGALFMAAGYVCLAISSGENLIPFYIGLFLVAFGTGIFKVNMSVSVGNLYRDRIELKDAGFSIYYMGVNLGATIAPLAATFINNTFDSYNYSFWAAAVGMIFCLVIFETGKRHLISIENYKDEIKNSIQNGTVEYNKLESRQRITTLIILFTIVVFFWIAFYQNGFGLTLFAERSTVRYSFLKPETYQFFNPFFILVLTPLLVSFFRHLNKRGKEPSTPAKIYFGMIIMGLSMIIMVVASLRGGNSDTNIMSPSWLIFTYLAVTLSEILISPMGQSYVSKVAPAKIQGLMMGLWFFAISLGSFGSGQIGKFYSSIEHHKFYIILALFLFFCSFLVLFFQKRLKRFAK